MFRLVIVASLLAGCRVSLEDTSSGDDTITGRACVVSTSSQPCMDATTHSDLAWIEQKIFTASCTFSGCHNGDSSRAGMIDLRPGKSRAHLVDFASKLDPTRKLVVAGDVDASYAMLMLRDVPPAMASPPGSAPPGSIGYMPQGTGGTSLCCQKLDVLERWITAGAPSM
jgi:hypothetical protein